MSWGYFEPYVSIGEKRAKAQKKLEQLRKKDPNIQPVIIEGKKIAKTWWGMAWCKNLESYADFHNRLGRGSAYVKNGFVIDLRIEESLITAQVFGSSVYKVNIKIDKLSDSTWHKISDVCAKRIDSVAALAEGKFPKELEDIFTQKGGLFPSPKEIHMDCSCPDWADVCKHVAAAIYGVGARLDDDPLLFFKLRGVDPSELIKKSVDEKMSELLKNAGRKSRRAMSAKDATRVFGEFK
ncbi:hypothetical protein FACS189490_08890 [Clostridia bacterium]|nr:hypothetical protein FACS189490_08890 [Clostridia bacterium]